MLPYATISGDRVTVHNIRNFDYRSETDFSPAYYDKTFDLRELQSVDIVAAYWTGPAIAHDFVSFGFTGDDHLAVSIEVRKPKGEGYSTLKGFFRQYELFYVVADERDVIRLRTNYREDPPEDVYIYRTKSSSEARRRLFLEYMHRINALRTQPEFYNTLTTNCTTNIWTNSHVNPERVPLTWKILASGYVPEYLYEQGRLETMGLLASPNCSAVPTSTNGRRRQIQRRTFPNAFALGTKPAQAPGLRPARKGRQAGNDLGTARADGHPCVDQANRPGDRCTRARSCRTASMSNSQTSETPLEVIEAARRRGFVDPDLADDYMQTVKDVVDRLYTA